MEPICVVRTALTKAMDREIYWTWRYYRKKERILSISLGAIMLLCAIHMMCDVLPFVFTYWRYLSIKERIFYPSVMGFFWYCFIHVAFQYRFTARRREKSRRKTLGDKPAYAEILFYDTYLCHRANLSFETTTIPYVSVKELKETKHYYAIITSENLHFFDKRGFVKGSCEQALQILREKGNIK